ncbi:diguanylate cyclase domain-containing protein [Dokdonella sp.]|uniref:diguanylate cyclase domain-containing protein n=1 Tax=Dokdonella sp. TaxID=2291710 RepID=UPI003C35C3D9
MSIRYGLQARFITLVIIALLLSLLALAGLLQRQVSLQRDVVELTRESIQNLVLERLQEQARAVGDTTAEVLINPLYNFDLEMIGRIVGDVLAQPDVQYATVFDPQGAVIHDGSDAIASYGQVMSDPLAAKAIGASETLLQRDSDVVDVSSPILLGDERLGGVRIGYSLASVQRYEVEATRALEERLNSISRRYFLGVTGLIGLAILLGIIVSVIMQRVLIRPIRRLADAALEIEAGNLSVSLPGKDNKDEIGELIRAFERMTEGIARRDRDIRRIANTDSLTGLANRRSFRESLDAHVAFGRKSSFAVILADIDDFKPVNDSWGHDAGDKLLCRFAERFREVVNADEQIETKPARLGGDEFILLVQAAPGVDTPLRQLVTRLAERLIEEFGRPTTIDDRTFQFSASFGIAVFPDDGITASQIMKAGDVAMYEAKRAGKNRYSFHDRSTSNPGRRKTLSEDASGGS